MKYGYNGPYQYEPLSPWAYVGYTILFMIPVVGLVFLLVFTFSSGNINRRCYARSYWAALLLGVIVIAVLTATGVFSGLAALSSQGVSLNDVQNAFSALSM